MKTEQINIRLDADLVSALERVAREEALDRATAIRRLLETSVRAWELERALLGYRRGESSLGRAAEEAGLTQWELIDAARAAGLAYPLDAEEAQRRVDEISEKEGERDTDTLPDIPPKPGGVLLVGINPAPVSVAAGHYYQGRLGRRLWRRLETLGLFRDALPGAEDEAFKKAGHGLTDLVKRPAPSSADLSEDELIDGVDVLRAKVRQWKPGLVLFAFKEPARRLLGEVSPGAGPTLEGVPTFLLSGPYAPRAQADRVDTELRRVLGASVTSEGAEEPQRTQRVTANDLDRGQIRLPRPAKRFFPTQKGAIEIVLRGTRVAASYDPRTGPDRERSAVLRVGREALGAAVQQGETLAVTRGLGGIVILE